MATLIPELKQIGFIGKGRQGQKIYDINGTAITQCAVGGAGGGAKGLYAVPKLTKIGDMGKSQAKQIYDIEGISPTLCSGGDGHLGGWNGFFNVPEIKIINGVKYLEDYSRVRKLMPRECARVMGFSDDFKIVVSDSQAYKQFGNAVVPGVVKEICKAVIKKIILIQ